MPAWSVPGTHRRRVRPCAGSGTARPGGCCSRRAPCGGAGDVGAAESPWRKTACRSRPARSGRLLPAGVPLAFHFPMTVRLGDFPWQATPICALFPPLRRPHSRDVDTGGFETWPRRFVLPPAAHNHLKQISKLLLLRTGMMRAPNNQHMVDTVPRAAVSFGHRVIRAMISPVERYSPVLTEGLKQMCFKGRSRLVCLS